MARRYIERVVGCIENITNPGCTLSPKDKKEEIARIIRKPLVQEMVRVAKPRSRMMKIMLSPIRSQNVWLTYRECCLIFSVKRKNTRLFASLKAKR